MVLTRPGMMSGPASAYVQHKPEQTLLYKLVEQYWPEFWTQLKEIGRFLPRHVTREFENYLVRGRLENGFLRVCCNGWSLQHLVALSCKRRSFCTSCGARRMAQSAPRTLDAGKCLQGENPHCWWTGRAGFAGWHAQGPVLHP